MITCNLMGGLGNQLFQIFTTISCAINIRQKFAFIDSEKLETGKTRPTYWNHFLLKLKLFTTPIFPKMTIIQEKNFHYNPIDLLPFQGQDICLYGYFQSYKYFAHHFETICKMIGIEKIKNSTVLKANMNQDYLNNTISMHFRLGDYKNLQHVHPIMTVDYYKNAISFICSKEPNSKSVLYFCEEEDIYDVNKTIIQLKKSFPDITFIGASIDLADWEQMMLMSSCKHNIIANSSFSWWAAHFNTNPNKMVCYPSKWFGQAASHDTSDLCPEEWNKISIFT